MIFCEHQMSLKNILVSYLKKKVIPHCWDLKFAL